MTRPRVRKVCACEVGACPWPEFVPCVPVLANGSPAAAVWGSPCAIPVSPQTWTARQRRTRLTGLAVPPGCRFPDAMNQVMPGQGLLCCGPANARLVTVHCRRCPLDARAETAVRPHRPRPALIGGRPLPAALLVPLPARAAGGPPPPPAAAVKERTRCLRGVSAAAPPLPPPPTPLPRRSKAPERPPADRPLAWLTGLLAPPDGNPPDPAAAAAPFPRAPPPSRDGESGGSAPCRPPRPLPPLGLPVGEAAAPTFPRAERATAPPPLPPPPPHTTRPGPPPTQKLRARGDGLAASPSPASSGRLGEAVKDSAERMMAAVTGSSAFVGVVFVCPDARLLAWPLVEGEAAHQGVKLPGPRQPKPLLLQSRARVAARKSRRASSHLSPG